MVRSHPLTHWHPQSTITSRGGIASVTSSSNAKQISRQRLFTGWATLSLVEVAWSCHGLTRRGLWFQNNVAPNVLVLSTQWVLAGLFVSTSTKTAICIAKVLMKVRFGLAASFSWLPTSGRRPLERRWGTATLRSQLVWFNQNGLFGNANDVWLRCQKHGQDLQACDLMTCLQANGRSTLAAG